LRKYIGSENFSEKKVCEGCPLYQTKTEAAYEQIEKFLEIPENKDKKPELVLRSGISIGKVVSGIYKAFDLHEIQESGGTFQYPDSLTIQDWECLKAFSGGKVKAENEEAEKKKEK
jgi:hypothetical protein